MKALSISKHKCWDYVIIMCDFCGEFGCGDCMDTHQVPDLDPVVEPLTACTKCFEGLEKQ